MQKHDAVSQRAVCEEQKSAVSAGTQEEMQGRHPRHVPGHSTGQETHHAVRAEGESARDETRAETWDHHGNGKQELVSTGAADVATIARRVELPYEFKLSAHAWMRMTSRGISAETVAAALTHGRMVYARGARHYVIGKREIAGEKQNGKDLRQHEGIQVVALPDEPLVYTVYRNRNFRQTLRPSGHRRRVHH